MLPVNPDTLDRYHPDQLKKDALQFAKSELRAGADRLIETTPGAQQMRENYEFVDEHFLKGVPKLDLKDLSNMSLAEGEAIAEIILVNVANYYGIPINSLRVEDWLNQGFDYLKEELRKQGEEILVNAAAEAMSQFGLQSVSAYASEIAPLAGLITTTYQALEDGNLSQGEAMTISTSAMTSASTMFAGSAAAAGLGVVGAVFAPAAIGTAYLEGLNAAEQEFRKQARIAAKQATAQDEAAINRFLQEAESQYNLADRAVWDQKEHAIAAVASDWSLLEHRLNTSFQLRYFPGAPPPIRGGWYFPQPITGGGAWFMQKTTCDKLSGCLYFPGSDSFLELRDVLLFFKQMRSAGFWAGKDRPIEGKYHAPSPYQFPQISELYGGQKYAYYWRALRAFDALVPERQDSQGRSAGFWVYPGHEFRQAKQLKDFGLLAWDKLCRLDPYCRQACPYTGPCPDSTKRRAGRGAVEESYFSAKVNKTRAWDMASEATEYVEDLFLQLQEDSNAVDTYRTRIQGDLMQTAGAVKGEQAAAKRLTEIAQQVGYRPNTQVLTALDRSEKEDIKILDDSTRDALKSLDKRSKRINIGVLTVGGAAFAAGAGVWYARGKPWPL